MLAKRIVEELQEISELNPLDVHSWGHVRIDCDAAKRILEGEEIYCVIETLVNAGMKPTMIRQMLTSSGTETQQFAGKPESADAKEGERCE